MTAPDQTYHDTLLLYYEEEIMGEGYFRAVAGRFDCTSRAYKLELMAQVERHAANAVWPLLQKYGLTPRSDAALHAIGLAQAQSATSNWDSLIADMQKTFPDYMPEFHALEEMGPASDRARLAFLTQHEVATIKFLDLEIKNHDSIGPMLTYLAVDTFGTDQA